MCGRNMIKEEGKEEAEVGEMQVVESHRPYLRHPTGKSRRFLACWALR